MNAPMENAIEWLHQGTWGILSRWFKVPRQPPSLPKGSGETVTVLRPSDAWLRYLKFQFWVMLTIIDCFLIVVWIAITVTVPMVGLVLLPPWTVLVVLPDVIAYVAIHLRYDTTWYVLSARSMRIRRGIWVLRETTITYENIQNVAVNQGPLQRLFGIADVVVQTAGGGGHAATQQEATMLSHVGLLEGLTNALEVRELVMNRVRGSNQAGLGDELPATVPGPAVAAMMGTQHIAVLREIRDAARELVSARLQS